MTVGELKKFLANVPDAYILVRGGYKVDGVKIQPGSKEDSGKVEIS